MKENRYLLVVVGGVNGQSSFCLPLGSEEPSIYLVREFKIQ
jgi:hypothetical protein